MPRSPHPGLYGIPVEVRKDDPDLEQRRASLIQAAAQQLGKSHLVKYASFGIVAIELKEKIKNIGAKLFIKVTNMPSTDVLSTKLLGDGNLPFDFSQPTVHRVRDLRPGRNHPGQERGTTPRDPALR